MADLTKYAKGKRMVHEDEIKQIKENSKDIEEIEELLEITPTIYYTNDITHLTNNFINGLQAGDIVIKQTGSGANNQNHAYRVSFKKKNEGMCLTYTDASCSETVSYDKSAINWHYNSTDVTIFSEFATKDELPAEVEAITPTGTETTLKGLKIGNTSYKVGGEQPHLYCHTIYFGNNSGSPQAYGHFNIYTTSNVQFDSSTLAQWLKNEGYDGTTSSKYYPCLSFQGSNIANSSYPSTYAIYSSNGTTIKLKGFYLTINQNADKDVNSVNVNFTTIDNNWNWWKVISDYVVQIF